jgi:hypothetical protein
VEDYIKLLRKHQSASHKFLHQAAKNDKDLTEKWVKYAEHSVSQFRRSDPATTAKQEGGAGDMTPALQDLFSSLSTEQKKTVVDTLDSYTAYTMVLTSTSHDKWNAFNSSSPSLSSALDTGPGIYLAKWQHLLDSTRITPAAAHGPVRTGRDKSVKEKVGVGVETGNKDAASANRGDAPEPPDVGNVIDLLSERFKEEIQKRGKKIWEEDHK